MYLSSYRETIMATLTKITDVQTRIQKSVGEKFSRTLTRDERARRVGSWMELLEEASRSTLLDLPHIEAGERELLSEGVLLFFHTLCVDLSHGTMFHNFHLDRTERAAFFWLQRMEDVAENALDQSDMARGMFWGRVAKTCTSIFEAYEREIGWEECEDADVPIK